MKSLRTRLLLLFLLAFLPIAALTVREPLSEREAQIAHAGSEATLRVELAQLNQRELINDSRRYLNAIGMLPSVALSDAASCARNLQLFRKIIDEGWSVSRVLPDGTVDCSSNAQESDIRDSFVVAHAAQLANDTQGMIGPYVVSQPENGVREPLVKVYWSVRDSVGAFRGVMTVRRRMRWLADLAREVRRDSQAVVALVDSSGLVLARYPDPAHVVGTILPHASRADSAAPELPYNGIRDATPSDPARLYVNRELPSMASQPVFLNIGVSARPIIAVANAALFRSIAWLCLWIALTIACAWWAAERVVLRDVRALLSATERLGAGDLNARTGLQVHDGELGQLANAFDKMAHQLEERQERLAQAQKMESVGQLAGGVAHDFNNLLTAIIGNAEIARDQLPAGHPAREEIRHVLDAARRSGQLTRQLLAFAKRHTMDVHVLTLDVLLADVTSLLQRLIGEHITLAVNCEPNLHATRIDPTQFEQIIMNLAVNARDAMPTGGNLTIDVRNADVHSNDRDAASGVMPGSWVALTVTDTGAGMPPEVARRAFEPFFTTKGVGEGTGLGLAVVYGTVQQHAGHVHIESAPGVGTTVRILLPPSSAVPEELFPTRTPNPERPPQGAEHLLLVEDEPAVRAVSARLLRSNGYSVLEAVDGTDAMEKMANGNLSAISLLITDVVMPRMGGPELAVALRRERPDLPVLLVSGYSEAGIPETLMQTPGTVFVEKPFSSAALLMAVRRLLDEQLATAQ